MYTNARQILDIWYTIKKQEHHQPVPKCTYFPVLGSFNNWNVIQLSHKSTPFDAFDEIHQVVLDGISDNMASLVQSGKYGVINTYKTSTNGFYVIMFTSEEYTLQNNTTIDVQIITTGELVVKSQYICSMQESTDWFWDQHPQQEVITGPTYITLHPLLDVIAITYIHDIPNSVCNRTQEKKSISRHPSCLTDSDYNYILEKIDFWDKI